MYLQVWSEAGDPLLFEVSSAHGHPAGEAYLTPEMRESLLGRGFEIGGPARNFRKKVTLDGKQALRSLAREMLAIAIDVLRYDGLSPLTFRLHQDSRMDAARVFRAIQPDDFRRLLERWGIAAKFVPTGEPIIQARSADVAFTVEFHVECPPPFTTFEVVTLTSAMRIPSKEAARVASDINRSITLGRAIPTSLEQVLLTSTVVIGGGVAPASLHRQILGWVEEVRELLKTTKLK